MGFIIVVVNIIDVNDVVLEFFYIGYKVFVLMNVGKGRFFIQVQVRDFDFGEVGRVIYNIYDVFLIILVIFFIIDLVFGIVSVKVDLSEKGKIILFFFKYFFNFLGNVFFVDISLNYFFYYFYFLVGSVYQFFVEVVDYGSFQLKSNVLIEIYIFNDNQLVFLIKLEYIFMIIEDKRVGDIVGRVVKVIESLVDFSIVSGFIKDRNSLEIVFINQEGEIFLLDLWRIQKLFQYKFIVVIFLRENLQVVVYFQINILV